MPADTDTSVRPDAATEHIRLIAHDLLPQSERIASQVVAPVLRDIPEVAPRGPQLATRSTQQNISAMLATLAFGLDPAAFGPPPATFELVDQLIETDGDLTAILHGYRIGHQRFWDIWAEHVGRRVADRDELQAVLSASSSSVFALFDAVVAGIVEYHRASTAAPGAVEHLPPTPAAIISELLGPHPVDLDGAMLALRYDVRNHHVAAVVSPTTAEQDVRNDCDELARHLGRPHAIRRPTSDGSVWMWFGWPDEPADSVLTAVAQAPMATAIIGLGEPGRGQEGFRRTHEEALKARDTRRMHPDGRPGIARHRDVELAGLICLDPERARAFARRHLGALARDDQRTAGLRRTVQVYFACGHNKARTAEALFVHQRTVSYRMARVEQLLGHSVQDRAAELQAALIISDTLGTAGLHGR